MPGPIPFELALPPFPKDRYQVLSLLGQGGMGKVYQGRDRHLNRLVALKFLRGDDPAQARKLALEAQFQAGVDHPNIRKVHEVGLLDGLPCISMEYIHGEDLQAWIPRLSCRQAAGLVAQAACAAHAAHQQGLVHRDLKPRNIMVEAREAGELRAVVMDFGLARPMQNSSLGMTESLVGTPCFISPEQITGQAPPDARSDVYGLGATLYAACTGTPPFAQVTAPPPEADPDLSSPLLARQQGPEPHALEALRRVLEEDPTPPRALSPNLPLDLETIILKCLEKEPARRYPSARQLAEDLERFLQGEPILARRSGPWERLGKSYRRNPGPFRAGAALVLVLAGLGGWAIEASRRTRWQAELTQRFAAEALGLAQHVRLNSMSPLHDRRLQMAWLLKRVEEIKAQTEALGPVAAAPGAYAQAQGYLALEQPELALACLNTAWRLGLRLPQVTFAQGQAYLSLYEKGMEKVATSSPLIAQVQRNHLLTEYRDPALRCFDRGLGPEGLEPYRKTALAHLHGDDGETIAQAERTLQETPWMFEVLRFEAQAWNHRAQASTDPALRTRFLDRAQHCWQELTTRAPSNPAHWAGRANQELTRAEQALRDHQPGAAQGLEQAEQACRNGQIVDPTHVSGFITRATLQQLRSRLLSSHDYRRAEPDADLAETTLEAARHLYPLDPDVLEALAQAQLYRADLARRTQEPTRAVLDRAHATLEQALAIAPRDAGLRAMRVGLDAAEATELEALGQDSRPLRRQALAGVESSLQELGGTWLLERVHQESRLRLATSCLLQGDPVEAAPLVESCLARLSLLQAEAPNAGAFQDLAGIASTLRLTCAQLQGEEPTAIAVRLRKLIESFARPGPGSFELDLNRARLDLFEARGQEALGQDPRPRLALARSAMLRLGAGHPCTERPYGNLAYVAFVGLRYRLRRGQDPTAACQETLAWSGRALLAHKQHGLAMAMRGAALSVQAEQAPGPERAGLRKAALGLLTQGLSAEPSLRQELAPFLQRARRGQRPKEAR